MYTHVFPSIEVLRAQMDAGTLTSEALTQRCLERIEAVDGAIGAFLHVDAQGALKSARAVDEKRRAGATLPPLAGIPMAIKDNLCTVDMPTTCASKMLEDYVPPYDAEAVRRLRAQDAVILGKLNMDEFAMGGATQFSHRHPTYNPVDTSRVPGGSSGGSAAAVAAGMAVYALGSDTGGSVRQPGAYCGVVGMKPTYGAVSRRGLIAFASSLDQVGILARHPEDVREVLQCIAGYDAADGTSSPKSDAMSGGAFDGDFETVRFILPELFLEQGLHEEVRTALVRAVRLIERAGGTVLSCTDPTFARAMGAALPAYYLLSSAEASSNLARFDGIRYGHRTEDAESLEALYRKSRGEGFGPEVKRRILLGTYALSGGYYDAYYAKAQRARDALKTAFDAVMRPGDVILSPVTPTVAFPVEGASRTPVELYMEDVYTVPVNLAGLPALSIPCGVDAHGLPIGLQLIGTAFQDAWLIELAAQVSQLLKGEGERDQ